MVFNSQRTLYNIDLHLSMLYNKPYNIIPNTSLNEKFEILPNEQPEVGTYPNLKYYCIGIGGNVTVDNTSGYVYSEHTPLDGALFEHIPFVMKEIDSDLSASEKLKYRFRRLEVHNNKTYACYYLKVIPDFDLRDYFYRIQTNNGVSTLSILDTNIASILNPTPKPRSINYNNIENVDYVAKVAKMEFSLYNNEIEELKNVLYILNKVDRQLTEIGICTGIDTILGDALEAKCVQIAYHNGVNLDLTISLNRDGAILKTIEIGGTEPLTY